MKQLRFVSMFAVILALCLASGNAAETLTIPLWPQGPATEMQPKSEATVKLIQSYGGIGPDRISDISDPTMTIYRPEHPNGSSVLVAPGGGFMFLSYAHEGTHVCEWLNSLGVTAVLLKYRTPTRDERLMHELPVQDAQRALTIVRDHAAEWKLDPHRVGMLGFSAGANVAGHVAWDQPPTSAATVEPQRPDFLIFIYGGGFLEKDDSTKLRVDFALPPNAAPAFFLVAHDDKSNPIEAARLYLEYQRRGLPAELHIYAKGGHGFGMRKNGAPISEWPQRCGEWMASQGFLTAK